MGRDDSGPAHGFRIGAAATVGAAHFAHDVFSAFLAPLLPLLIRKLDLTLFQAGWLDFLTRIPSVLNPVLGALVDRGGISRALVVVAPSVTGIAMCLTGLAPGLGALAVLLLTCGFSIAVFHMAAPVIAADASGNRVGRGMSFFMAGGELARTAGPLLAAQAVSWLTLEGLWKLIPVCLASSVALWWRLRRIPSRPSAARRPLGLLAMWRRMWRVFAGVAGILVTRGFMAACLTTFLPTFLVSRGETLGFASACLSGLELAGAVGVLVSGTLSDWIGRRRVLLGAVGLSPPLMLLFLWTDGAPSVAFLVALGFASLSTMPVMMAAVIESAGEHRAAANGTYMMLSFPVRSFVALAVGAMGDALGLETTYAICAAIAALGVPFVFLLPAEDRRGP